MPLNISNITRESSIFYCFYVFLKGDLKVQFSGKGLTSIWSILQLSKWEKVSILDCVSLEAACSSTQPFFLKATYILWGHKKACLYFTPMQENSFCEKIMNSLPYKHICWNKLVLSLGCLGPTRSSMCKAMKICKPHKYARMWINYHKLHFFAYYLQIFALGRGISSFYYSKLF